MATERFVDRLLERIGRVGAPVCVGLDPVVDRLPKETRARTPNDARAIERFCVGVLDSVAGVTAAVKPQSACFERLGSAGVDALANVIAHARSLDLPVVLDAKRGDMGSSSGRHYAAAAANLGADAITVNAYLGPSSVEPYLDAGLGVFVLVRTSNPDSDRFQSARLESGGTVAEHMADLVREIGEEWLGASGMSDTGAVVGLTKADDGAALRERMPRQVFLVPGYGAQGGGAADVEPLLTEDTSVPGRGILVSASRSVIYAQAQGGETWHDAVAREAQSMSCGLASVMVS